MSYKSQIEKELIARHWEISAINTGTEWWDDEHWKVQLKYNPSFVFYLCFIVGPLFEGERKKAQEIYGIKALTKLPESRNDDTGLIASLFMPKGKFDIKLAAFIAEIEKYKEDQLPGFS